MIECELCGGYFHPDEINNCPECVLEICEKCFENHVRFCREEDDINEEDNDEIVNLPRECPKCEAELELDIDYDATTLLCTKCDYQVDVTREFKRSDNDEL